MHATVGYVEMHQERGRLPWITHWPTRSRIVSASNCTRQRIKPPQVRHVENRPDLFSMSLHLSGTKAVNIPGD